MPFSQKQCQSWLQIHHCAQSLQQLCRKQYPQQLSIREQNVILNQCQNPDYQHWPLCSIYFQLIRNQELSCSISTFYKYCRLLKINRIKIKKNRVHESLVSKEPFEMLHLDVTIFKTQDGVRHHLYVIKDNFSRAILDCKVSVIYGSLVAKETLEGVLEKYQLLGNTGKLITDAGSENKGALSIWLSQKGKLWTHLVAQIDIKQSNSMVEGANKMLKYDYLFRKSVANTSELEKVVREAVENYNHRPNAQLHGCTPSEVLAGEKPNHERFKAQIKEASKQRLIANREDSCKINCSP